VVLGVGIPVVAVGGGIPAAAVSGGLVLLSKTVMG
jgi:hypothetical protein